MDADTYAELHGVLLTARSDAIARQAAAAAELATLRADRGGENADDEHDPEGATLSGEWAMRESVRVGIEREVAEIEAVLEAWDAGTYGVCRRCGHDIPPARLRARPAATHCVVCAVNPRR